MANPANPLSLPNYTAGDDDVRANWRELQRWGEGAAGWFPIKTIELDKNGPFSFTIAPNLPFVHLWIVGSVRSARAVAQETIFFRFNNDATAIYDWQVLFAGNAGPPGAAANINQAQGDAGTCPGSTATGSHFGPVDLKVFNYTSATQRKTLLGSSGFADNVAATSIFKFSTSTYHSLAPVNRIDFFDGLLGSTFLAGSALTLLGMVN